METQLSTLNSQLLNSSTQKQRTIKRLKQQLNPDNQFIYISIDWASFTMPATTSPRETKEYLGLLTPSEYTPAKHGAMGYDTMELGVLGHQVLSSERRAEHHVVLPGRYCRQLGKDRMITLLIWVIANKGKFTRLDIAFDDYKRVKTPAQIMRSCARGELITPFHDGHQHNQFRGKPGQGIYFGSPTSSRRLRIYDKVLENPEYNCVRWEIQNRDKYADGTARKIISSDNLGTLFKRMLVGCIDFRVPKKRDVKNTQRRKRTAWYASLVGLCDKLKYYEGKIQVTLERMRAWVDRQVAPTLACLFEHAGGDIGMVSALVDEGKRRWRTVHRTALTSAGVVFTPA